MTGNTKAVLAFMGGKNLVPDSGLQIGQATNGWGFIGAPFVIASNPGPNGLNAIKWPSGAQNTNIVTSNPGSGHIYGGTSYTFSFWADTRGITGGIIRIFYNSSTSPTDTIGDLGNDIVGLSNINQTRVSFTFTTPAGTNGIFFSLRPQNLTPTQDCYFSAPQIEIGSTATSYQLTPSFNKPTTAITSLKSAIGSFTSSANLALTKAGTAMTGNVSFADRCFNGGFEQDAAAVYNSNLSGTNQFPDGWTALQVNFGEMGYQVYNGSDSTKARSGSNSFVSLPLSGHSYQANSNFGANALISKKVSVTAGQKITLSGWMSAQGSVQSWQTFDAHVRVHFFNATGSDVGSTDGGSVTQANLGAGWLQKTTSNFTVPANAVQMGATVECFMQNTSGSPQTPGAATYAVYFDDISLIIVGDGTSTLTRAISTVRSASASFTGSVIKAALVAKSAAVTFVGASRRAVAATKSATLSFAGATTRAISTVRSAVASFSGACARGALVARSGTLSFATSAKFGITAAKAAALSFATSSARAVASGGSALLSFSGSVPRAIATTRSAALTFAGACKRGVSITKTGVASFATSVHLGVSVTKAAAMSFSSSIARLVSSLRNAALSFVGSIARRRILFVVVAAVLSMGGKTTRSIRIAGTSSLTFTSTCARAIARAALTATLSFVGSLPFLPFSREIVTIVSRMLASVTVKSRMQKDSTIVRGE